MSDKAKILVVDDETAVVMMLVCLLTAPGYDADAASNAEKALRLAQSKEFDLITLDVDLPGGSGFEIYRGLRQIPHLKETPIVFVSGNRTTENQRRAFELGAVDFIEKPFNAREFISRISSHVSDSPARCESSLSDVFDERADTDTESFCKAT
jgi:DNA-binding response OmpR family regulator